MHRVHPLRSRGTLTPAFSSLLPLSFPQLPLEIQSLASSMFLIHAECTPTSSPGMFWYILEYSGLFGVFFPFLLYLLQVFAQITSFQ